MIQRISSVPPWFTSSSWFAAFIKKQKPLVVWLPGALVTGELL
jgi:hypothetical protein